MLSQFPTGDPYGPALANAHALEAKVARYPRIIVGSRLVSYLHDTSENSDTRWPTNANRKIAALCQGLIAQDTDGYWIVDYLNDAFTPDATNRSLAETVQSQACAFVQTEHEQFMKEGNRKLAERYWRLLAYFRSRGVT